MNYGFLEIGMKSDAIVSAEATAKHAIGRDDTTIAVSLTPIPLLSPEAQLRKALADGLLVVFGKRTSPLEVRYGKLYAGGRIEEVGLDDPALASRRKLSQLQVVHQAVAQLCSTWDEWKRAAEHQGRVRMEDIDEIDG